MSEHSEAVLRELMGLITDYTVQYLLRPERRRLPTRRRLPNAVQLNCFYPNTSERRRMTDPELDPSPEYNFSSTDYFSVFVYVVW